MNDPITNEPNRVIMRGEWVQEIVLDVAWSETDNIAEFEALFELDRKDHLAAEGYYQGVDLMRVIRRKSDGRLFGYPYWSSPGNDNYETQVDSNGEAHGFEYGYDADYTEVIGGEVFVWLPVEPFTITGYRVVEEHGVA